MGICSGKPQRKNDKQRVDSKIFKSTSHPYPKDEKIEGTTASTDNVNFHYQMIKLIGHGSFGAVQLAKLRKQEDSQHNTNEKLFAIKTILKERVKDKSYLLKRELDILKSLDHPNIIKFYEIYHDERYIHFVMEYCSGGDLFQYVMQKSQLDENEAASIMFQLFSSINYVHSKNIIHRDLKPENILFRTKDPNSEIKIIDFGLSRQFTRTTIKDKGQPSVVGTPLYVAPEVINEVMYEKECDCWSLGVIMYILLSGREPFYAGSLNEVYTKIRNGKYDFADEEWQSVSSHAKDLISKLLTVNPQKRITCEEALKHKWLEVYKKKRAEQVQQQFNSRRMQSKVRQLMEYNPEQKLKKEAIKILINHQIPESELLKLKETFTLLDQDGSGQLDFDELLEAMHKMHIDMTEQELYQWFKQVHSEGTEERNPRKMKINYTEFIAISLDLKQHLNKEKLWTLFKYFDIQNVGYITVENIKEVIAREGRKVSEAELKAWIDEIDKNKDGKVEFEDFCKMMNPDFDLEKCMSDPAIISPNKKLPCEQEIKK